jgi:MFS family permease
MFPASLTAPGSLLGHPPFRLYFAARVLSRLSYLIGTVAIGWQIYAMTGSAFYLGMVGLAQFIPTALLVFIAGHAADRYDRRRVAQTCQIAASCAALILAWGSFAGWLTIAEIFAAVTVFGTASAFESPVMSALLPGVIPEGMLQRGTALSTAAVQIAIISGPAIGGLSYGIAPGVPYALMVLFWLSASVMAGSIQLERNVAAREPPTLQSLFAGVHFVRSNPSILGTISLDLFAVLLGGATALMPIYARDILHTGPWGLGILRGAPAAGALTMTYVLTRYPISRRVGMRMFQAVIVFGAATVVFALSRDIRLTAVALIIMGAADTVSMVIRISLVQLATPDNMRGRVGAVNFLFINASNQLGEFESGMAAALFGTVASAVIGGVGTIAVALLWMKLFPALRDVERLE